MRHVERVIFSTDDPVVPVTITYPAPMDQQELADVKEFLAIWVRSMERRTAAASGVQS